MTTRPSCTSKRQKRLLLLSEEFTHRVRFSIISNIGHYDVSMVVSSDNRASATVSGMWRGRLTWDGHLETVNNSRVFKGQNTI